MSTRVFVAVLESCFNAKVSARQQCVYEGPSEKIYDKSTQETIMLKSTSSGLHCCRWHDVLLSV